MTDQLISNVYSHIPSVGQTGGSGGPVNAKWVKPKNFVNKKTKGMNRSQYKKFKRKLTVDKQRSSK